MKQKLTNDSRQTSQAHRAAKPHARAMRPDKREPEAVLSPLNLTDEPLASLNAGADDSLGAVEAAPATGFVKVSPSSMTLQQLLETLQRVNVSMNGTPAYSSLPIMAEISAAAGAFAAFLGNLAVEPRQPMLESLLPPALLPRR